MALRNAFRNLGRACLVVAALSLTQAAGFASAQAQTAPATPAAPETPAASPPPAATPPASAPAATAPPAASAPPAATAPAATPPPDAAPAPPASPEAKEPDQASAIQTVTLEARPVAVKKGSATWDDAYKTITDSFGAINAALAKNGIKAAGRPLAVFTETDDKGFKFEGMIPIDKPADGKTTFAPDVTLGQLPAGKALKFEHRGAYDDILSTYETITAYLDEKGLEARDLFIEEYLNDIPNSDDTSLAVDIYVYIK